MTRTGAAAAPLAAALVVAGVLAGVLAGCGQAKEEPLTGYGEADYVYVSSLDGGRIASLKVVEGDAVAEGAPVFTLDPSRAALSARSAQASAAAARARTNASGALAAAVARAEAEAQLARANLRRTQELYEQGFVAKAGLDTDRAALASAEAAAAQARAERDAAGSEAAAASAEAGLARERLSDVRVNAPVAGRVERIFRRPGEIVGAGEPVVALLPPANVKVRFFAPQELLPKLTPGAEVTVTCDGCNPVPARVSYVAAEPQFTPPVIYSREHREKLVFMIEARPANPAGIRPGVPVDVSVP